MNSVIIPVLGAIVFLVGMRFYAVYVDRKIVRTDGKRATPTRPRSSARA